MSPLTELSTVPSPTLLLFAAAAGAAIGLLIVAAIQLSPSSWWRAVPRGDARDVEAAVIMGFGYVQRPGGPLEPGEADVFMFNWVRTQYPKITTILGQEGVVQAARASQYGPSKMNDVRVLRIHAHDPRRSVNTLDAAVCAVLKLRKLQASTGRGKVLIVGMPIHLWRCVRCFEKAKAELYPELELVVPSMPDVPFPRHSAQWRTRSPRRFRFAEIIGRVRDLWLPFSRVSSSCCAPVAPPGDCEDPDSEPPSKALR
jgi:hypothetical protein